MRIRCGLNLTAWLLALPTLLLALSPGPLLAATAVDKQVTADANKPGWSLLLPTDFRREPTDSPLAINYKTAAGALINLTFFVDDEWRDVEVAVMLDEFMQGVLAIPGSRAGKQFQLQQPLQSWMQANTHPQQLTFSCQDWRGPGKQLGRMCLAKAQDLKVLLTLSAPLKAATAAAEQFQLALLSLRYDWDVLLQLRDSQP